MIKRAGLFAGLFALAATAVPVGALANVGSYASRDVDRSSIALPATPNCQADGARKSALETLRARQAGELGQSTVACDSIGAAQFMEAFHNKAGSRRGIVRSRHIRVSKTAFDAQWQRARAKPSWASMQRQLKQAGVERSMLLEEKISRVNRHVNQTTTYKVDPELYGRRDYWATAAETLKHAAGDCEDFAILKKKLLEAAGVPTNQMRLHLLRDLTANADHAFLVIKTANGEQVLDNRTDRIIALSDTTEIRPILSFSGDRRWIHAIVSG